MCHVLGSLLISCRWPQTKTQPDLRCSHVHCAPTSGPGEALSTEAMKYNVCKRYTAIGVDSTAGESKRNGGYGYTCETKFSLKPTRSFPLENASDGACCLVFRFVKATGTRVGFCGRSSGRLRCDPRQYIRLVFSVAFMLAAAGY